jgi:hypothetical protein
MEGLSYDTMKFGSEEEFKIAITELKWIRKNRKVSDVDFETLSLKYNFPQDFLNAGLDGLKYPDDFRVSTSKWFPIIFSWNVQREEASNKLVLFYIDFVHTRFTRFRTFLFSVVLSIFSISLLANYFSADALTLAILILTFGTFLGSLYYQLMDPVSDIKKEMEDYEHLLKQKGLEKIIDNAREYAKTYNKQIQVAGNILKQKIDSQTTVISYEPPTVENKTLILHDCEDPYEAYKKRISELEKKEDPPVRSSPSK